MINEIEKNSSDNLNSLIDSIKVNAEFYGYPWVIGASYCVDVWVNPERVLVRGMTIGVPHGNALRYTLRTRPPVLAALEFGRALNCSTDCRHSSRPAQR